MKTKSLVFRLITVVFTVAVLLLATLTFQVQEYESAVVTRFGEPVRILEEPGMYGKWPWPISSVQKLDQRIDIFEMRLAESLTRDQRNVVVPLFVAWRIEDPLTYLQSVGSAATARERLDNLISSAKHSVLARYNFSQLISRDPEQIRLDQVQADILREVRDVILEDYGVRIVDLGIQRIALPESNTEAVFDRMRAERAKVASEIRAEGRERADRIRAEADALRTVTLADARREAAELTGQGESEAARIYRETYSQDESLYRFLRELEALERITSRQTRIVTDSSQSPFHWLNQPSGGDNE